MGTTVTLRIRTLVLAIAMAVALCAAYFFGTTASATSNAAAATDTVTGDVPSIVMSGSGDATGVPDQLTFALAISSTASDVSSALQSASTTTAHVLQAVDAADIARKDVQTTGLSVNPVYDYSGNGPGVITGYNATEDMSILVRSLPDAGATITAAVQAGGDSVRLHDVRLQIGDKDALMHQARADAFAQARTKAEQYAAAAGRQLGDVTSVREVSSGGSTLPVAFAAASDSVERSVPIRAGTADLHVTVRVVWSFA
jgi:uncharacterized protein YggE